MDSDLSDAILEPVSYTTWPSENYITDWKTFSKRIRSSNRKLLHRLDDFPNSILVTGCQRSGTTLLSRILVQSKGTVNYWFSPDDELDAALILSGYVNHIPHGRYCFQITYLNERYHEILDHKDGHKLLWVLRNPWSVVYSMLHNWNGAALDELFLSCGAPVLHGIDDLLFRAVGIRGILRLRRACWAYNGKILQLLKLSESLSQNELLVVDYDQLVTEPNRMLPNIYNFLSLDYEPEYSAPIHSKSIEKKNAFSSREAATISAICNQTFTRAKEFAQILQSGTGEERVYYERG